MGGLIDDLLLLARLDEERPLVRSDIDLAVIGRDAVDDARARDPERPISVDAARPVIVSGDEPRLRQMVANLLENAQVHTPAGAPVRVEVGARDGMGVLAVIDSGPGIDLTRSRTCSSASIAVLRRAAAMRLPELREAASRAGDRQNDRRGPRRYRDRHLAPWGTVPASNSGCRWPRPRSRPALKPAVGLGRPSR